VAASGDSKRSRPGRRTPKWLRKPGRVIASNPVFVSMVARLAVWYLKLTFHTNKWTVDPEDALERAQEHLPAICAVWHGQQVLLPVIPLGLTGSVMISRSLDGEFMAKLAHAAGAKAIRASGGRDSANMIRKGGLEGFLEMKQALDRGENVVQTADISKGTARRAGAGIISLAKRSGRPIIPIAIASSRRWVVSKAWDRMTFNLPFGKAAICMGDPVWVAADADDAQAEEARLQLQAELDRITERAYALTGNPE